MIWHPLVQAILALDLLSLLLLGLAAATAIQVLLFWRPRSAAALQLRLEARMELASLQGRTVLVLQSLALVLLVVAIASALPPLVQGAMCGTGALNALGPDGKRLLLLRLIALALLSGWGTLDGLNRQAPQGPLSPAVAKGLLLTLPAVVLTVPLSLSAFLALDPARPVDCCAVVYDNLSTTQRAIQLRGLTDSALLAAMTGGGALLALLSLLLIRRPAAMISLPWLVTTATSLWAPLAGITLTRVLAPYHYGVLHHHCPWCLFLPAQHALGYPLWGSLLLIFLLGISPPILHGAVRPAPELLPAAQERLRRCGIRLLLLLPLFLALAAGPSLVWRLRSGVWLG